jgi:hypothetical protein
MAGFGRLVSTALDERRRLSVEERVKSVIRGIGSLIRWMNIK